MPLCHCFPQPFGTTKPRRSLHLTHPPCLHSTAPHSTAFFLSAASAPCGTFHRVPMSRALRAKRAFVCVWAVLQLCHVITRYAAGKIIGGVCHGPIFLANVKAPDGSYVVSAQRNLVSHWQRLGGSTKRFCTAPPATPESHPPAHAVLSIHPIAGSRQACDGLH